MTESFPLVVGGNNLVAFRVEPSVRIVGFQEDDRRLIYPYRDSHGTKYLRLGHSQLTDAPTSTSRALGGTSRTASMTMASPCVGQSPHGRGHGAMLAAYTT